MNDQEIRIWQEAVLDLVFG